LTHRLAAGMSVGSLRMPDKAARQDLRERRRRWEAMHADGREPFDYSHRAMEILRHELVAATARHLVPADDATLLDVGCSRGQLTRRLATVARTVVAVDLSHAAAVATRAELRAARCRRSWVVVGSSTALPFSAERVDLVVLSDGLHSWHLTRDERALALGEAYRVTRRGGRALLTEFLNPQRFARFVDEARASAFRIDTVEYLHDRLWYQFESWFKAVRHRAPVRRILRSLSLARVLRILARPLGARGSRHVCIVASRAP